MAGSAEQSVARRKTMCLSWPSSVRPAPVITAFQSDRTLADAVSQHVRACASSMIERRADA
ncbi:hypothetical protein XbrCFBP1976_11930 [Xanthomonas bromi]|uniref:Uncharacterized protein n=1 Tax=Xanthomonas bromi TaxID=56449 RepID=A0ABX5BNY4_9XANT|nr:hypothetical protein XbrCFBP1976_11930 [Xanthomonas bromi]